MDEDTLGAETPMDAFERDTLNYIRHCFHTFRNLGLTPEEAVAKLVGGGIPWGEDVPLVLREGR